MHEARRQAYLAAMGIEVWEQRDMAPAAKSAIEPIPAATAQTVPELATRPVRSVVQAQVASAAPQAIPAPSAPPVLRADVAGLDWDDLQARVAACTACELHTTRTQTVFGVGNRSAELMIIGEAPGADEDRQGEPFVGKAGQLLNEMLAAIGLPREQVYIANILKCRPPNNRDPRPEEVGQCEPFLMRQVALVRPKVILALGRIAAHNLLKTQETLGRLRGKRYEFGVEGTPLLITYHPAYLLRTPRDKRKAWQDLVQARQLLAGE